MAGLFEALRPIQLLSPFHYYDYSPQGLREGFAWGESGVLLAASLAFLLLAILSFGQHDITVGRWALVKRSRASASS